MFAFEDTLSSNSITKEEFGASRDFQRPHASSKFPENIRLVSLETSDFNIRELTTCYLVVMFTQLMRDFAHSTHSLDPKYMPAVVSKSPDTAVQWSHGHIFLIGYDFHSMNNSEFQTLIDISELPFSMRFIKCR